MKSTTRKLFAIALVVAMIGVAGCAGWGTDGPADTGQNDTGEDTTNATNATENETNESDELNETNETNESETNETGPDEDTGDADAPASDPDKPDDPEEPKQPPEDDKAPEEPEQPPEDKPEEPKDPEQPPEDGDGEPEQPPEDDKTHTLTVEVINGKTGEPIEADGEIGIGSGDHQATEPIEDGKAVFEGVPAGQYGISADIPGHTTGTLPDHEVVVEGDTTYTLEVYPEPKEYTLTVTVVDAETGEPIEGAVVQGFGSNAAVYGDMLFAAETGTDGTASGPIVEGKWSLEVHADGYEFVQEISLTVDSDEELTIELQPERDELNETNETVNETNETTQAAA